MKLALKEFYVYVRTVLVVAVALAVVLVLFKNRQNRVSFWFFGITDVDKPMNVVYLVWGTAAATVIVSRIAALSVKLWKEWAALGEVKSQMEASKTQQQREADMAAREKRIDEKLKAMGQRDAATGNESAEQGERE
jgi:heme/copper-type cytochrome/quinol oxidase subunit 2